MPLSHPPQKIPLDAAPLEVVEHLVGHDALETAFQPRELLHVVDVEVADSRLADLLRFEQVSESGERLLERRVAAPVKEVEVDLLDIEPAESSIASRGHAVRRGVLWIELRHDEHLVATTRDRFTDNPLGAAIGVHLRGVDQRHPEVDPGPQRRDLALALARVFAHTPRPLAEDRDTLAAGKSGRTNPGHRE